MLFEFGERYQSLPGVIEAVDRARLADITDDMATLEGCTADQLRTALRAHYYPGITDADRVEFVRFRTKDADSIPPG